MKIIGQAILIFFLSTSVIAQNRLIFHTESVDSLLMWMKKGCNKKDIVMLANQPAARLMEQILRNNEKKVPDYKKILEEFDCNDSTSENIYLLNNAFVKRGEIAGLLEKLKKSDFSKNVYERAIKYFPDHYSPPRNYEVFYTAVGWQWGDAMSFDYMTENGAYALSDAGIPAIIFNLTLVVTTYGNTLAEQMHVMEDVMSHELFHAVFSDYTKVYWNRPAQESLSGEVIILMLNEGLAHYIANGPAIAEAYGQNRNIRENEGRAFEMLHEKAKIIFDEDQTLELRRNAFNEGTFGKFWDKYLCITGLFMIYHIEQYYGPEEINECVKNGPLYFLGKYEELQTIRPELRQLPSEITEYARRAGS